MPPKSSRVRVISRAECKRQSSPPFLPSVTADQGLVVEGDEGYIDKRGEESKMSRAMAPTTGFPALLKQVGDELSFAGFKGSGGVFRRLENGNCGIIEFQKSDESTSDETKFTVNLGVVCGKLFDRCFTSLEKVRVMDAHLNVRIGWFLPGSPDKWWKLRAGEPSERIALDVYGILKDDGIPYLLRFMNVQELVSLWHSGESPGLTEIQRVRILERARKLGLGGQRDQADKS